MKILIIGGTVFLGRHLVTIAQERGHEVTIFTRGKHNPDIFDNVEKLRGNRDGELDALLDKKWDAVIDTCGYYPRIVKQSVEMLKDKVEHYTFVSSISVYGDFSKIGITEDDEVGKIADETIEEITEESYGPLKALCENEVTKVFGENALIVRPGLIVGPHDPSGRFTYWVKRLQEGGKVLIPGEEKLKTQFIDVRDLAGWIIEKIEEKLSGTFNVTGPEQDLAFEELMQNISKIYEKDYDFVKVPDNFLLENQVIPYMELPLWIPQTEEKYQGFDSVSIQKALDQGLKFRPLKNTILDTLDWYSSLEKQNFPAGMKAEREEELIMKWEIGQK